MKRHRFKSLDAAVREVRRLRRAVVDGRQRLSAVLAFLRGQLPVPGEWFGTDATWVTFEALPRHTQIKFENRPIAFSEASVATVAAEKEIFDLINFGGVPQGQSDLVAGGGE
jgi:hypothetical protein